MYNTIWSISLSMIQASGVLLYDINLGATHTTILSIRGVTIPIYLVSSAMDSIRQRVVLFKPVPVLTSDPKSEFLCQSSPSCTEPTDPQNTSYTWDISHALVTTYHPYCHSPGALTEYLKQKLHHQRAKRLGRSLSAQVEQNVPLERNTSDADIYQGVTEAFEACENLEINSGDGVDEDGPVKPCLAQSDVLQATLMINNYLAMENDTFCTRS